MSGRDGGPTVSGAEHRFIDAGEVTLHAVVAGEGPLVVLLHGFPEFWWSWRCQLPALAAAGFRAVAVDLRGYGLSDRPRGAAAYAVTRLAGDVRRLIVALGADRAAAVVGHDWGGITAYRVAERHPEILERLVVLNSPHPVAMARGLLRHGQVLRSSYMLGFVLPWLPELAFSLRDGALLRRGLRALRATRVTDDDLEPYVEAARRAEWLRGGLGVYRAMALSALSRTPLARRFMRAPGRARERAGGAARRIDVPVLVIWGLDDPFLSDHLAEPPAAIVPNARVERLRGASHDVMLDAPERVNELLIGFLRTPAPRAAPSR